MTKETLAKLMERGYVPSPRILAMVERVEKSRAQFRIMPDEQNPPSISFKNNPNLIEVGKETLLEFLVSGTRRWGINDLVVILQYNQQELSFTTHQWVNVDYEFTLKTKITPKVAGKFMIDFLINGMKVNSLEIIAKYVLEEPEIVEDIKVSYTEEQKAKLITTVWGESAGAPELLINIPWIYYNLTKRNFNLLSRSSFYYGRTNINKRFHYEICMFYLGQGKEYKNNISVEYTEGKTIEKFCDVGNPAFIRSYKRELDIIKSYFENYIFDADKIFNPYYNWFGQGYYNDMNIRMHTDKIKWAKASQYFHLQNKGLVKTRFVKEFVCKDRWNKIDSTTYLIDDIAIENYFKINPSNIPEFEEGKCVDKYNTKRLCNSSEFNSIPGVHFP